MEKLNIMLVGDSEIREQARVALSGARKIEIAGELATFEERHLRFVEELSPSVVVIDGDAREFDSSAAVSMIGRCNSVNSVIVISQRGWVSSLSPRVKSITIVSTQEELREAIAPSIKRLHMPITIGRAA